MIYSHLTHSGTQLWAAILNGYDDSYPLDSYLDLNLARTLEAIWNAAAGSSVANHLTQSNSVMLAGIVNAEAGSAVVSQLTNSWTELLAAWLNQVDGEAAATNKRLSAAEMLAAIANAVEGGVDPLAPGVLTWTSDTDDNTPNLSLDLPDGVQDGDVIRWQVSTTPDFSGDITNQDGSDVGSDPTVFEWPDTLVDAQYWIRALIVRDSTVISTSNTETKTIDAVSDYETESEAIFAAFTTPPDDTRKGHIDTFVAALKTAGVWAKLDILYVFAAADSQAAGINWKNPGTYDASQINSPAFTADRGFASNGTSSHINTGFTPSTAGGNFSQNSAHMAGRLLDNGTDAGSRIGGQSLSAGNSTHMETTRASFSGGVAVYVMCGGSQILTGASATCVAHHIASRTNSTTLTAYFNGAQRGTPGGGTSSGLPSNPIWVLRTSNGYTSSGIKIASFSLGGGLSSTEAADYAAAEAAYMTAVGAA
jgi:hypothetical protein